MAKLFMAVAFFLMCQQAVCSDLRFNYLKRVMVEEGADISWSVNNVSSKLKCSTLCLANDRCESFGFDEAEGLCQAFGPGAQKAAVGKHGSTSYYSKRRLRCPPNFVRHKASCYWFSTTEGTYDSARSQCKQLGGDLAKITTKKEHDFIRSTATGDDYFVGATDLRLGGKWAWEGEATEIAYSDWAPGEPNGIDVLGEHCMNLMERCDYKMNDVHCDAKLNFICEQRAKR